MTRFKVWSYKVPIGHSKSSAVRRGMAPLTTEWAYALYDEKSGCYLVSKAVAGFVSEAAAIEAARQSLAENAVKSA
jgi:hypothetical protein